MGSWEIPSLRSQPLYSLSALTKLGPRCRWASIARGCLSVSRLWPGGTWTGSAWLWLRRFRRCSEGGFHPQHVRIRYKTNSSWIKVGFTYTSDETEEFDLARNNVVKSK